jgi:glycosyltransferase involved in cell wall biosynthesis
VGARKHAGLAAAGELFQGRLPGGAGKAKVLAKAGPFGNTLPPRELRCEPCASARNGAAHPVSVLIFHTSAGPPDQQAARALFEVDQLERFVTTVRDDPTSVRQRLVCGLGRLAGRDLSGRFRRRSVTEVPLEKVETHPWGELLRLAVGAVDRDGRLTDMVWEKAEIAFDRHVARSLHRGLTGVYGYEHCARATFDRARSLGLKIAYEMPAPERRFVQRIVDTEVARFPELQTPYHRHIARREDRRIARRLEEWASADVVIAASSFTRASFAAVGLDTAKVRIVPLGAPAVGPGPAAPAEPATDRPLRLLWAGTFGIGKGAHYLLEAWRTGGYGRYARLTVFGTVALPERVLRPLPEGIELGGILPRTELLARYAACDALIFPTLCDGWGMVVTEAWSRGLPVIATDRAGASDLLRNGENGLLIRAGDAQAIAEALDWCLSNRGELRAMREASLATARAWQWPDYRRRLTEVLREAGLFGAPA